jgi:hypothetical protein
MPRLVPAVAVVALAALAPLHGSRAEDPRPTGLAALSWLEGSWEGTSDEGTWETTYTSPRGGSMLSGAKLNHDGKERNFDFERWREEGGTVVMTPYPSGRKSKDFKAVEVDEKARRVVLENREHDFPKRFTYAASGKDKLAITLEGDQGGHPAKMTLDLTRRRTP